MAVKFEKITGNKISGKGTLIGLDNGFAIQDDKDSSIKNISLGSIAEMFLGKSFSITISEKDSEEFEPDSN